MRLAAVFDVATFIWNDDDFEKNKPKYYDVMDVIPDLLEKIKINKIPLILRDELLQEIQQYFPYNLVPKAYYDYQWLTLFNLSKINVLDYPDNSNSTIASSPSLIRDYFKDSTKKEITSLIDHLYHEKFTKVRLLTFSFFWEKKENLQVRNKSKKEIPVSFCDKIENHDEIILSIKKIFKHNHKHDDYKSSEEEYYGKKISPLSCYNERIDDKTNAQRLLDNSVLIQNDYFNFDLENQTYVKFEYTTGNVFHGFDIKPSEEFKRSIDRELN